MKTAIDVKAHGGRRHGLNPKGNATTIKIALDEQTFDLMEAAAALASVSRAEIVRRALRLYWQRMMG